VSQWAVLREEKSSFGTWSWRESEFSRWFLFFEVNFPNRFAKNFFQQLFFDRWAALGGKNCLGKNCLAEKTAWHRKNCLAYF
jgi:hypothetical protein